MKHHFIVTLDCPASSSEKRTYIQEAVQFMGGCYDKESPFFGLKSHQVKVKNYRPRKRKRRKTY